jgi:hypothetical protein
MYLYLYVWQGARDCYRFIVTGIVYDDHKIHYAVRHDFIISLAQGTRRVIRGHHHHNFLAV